MVCGSHDILKWFHQQGIPCFAYVGFRGDPPLPMICSVKIPAVRELTGRLIQLGHRRIVMLIGEEHRQPETSPYAAACMDDQKPTLTTTTIIDGGSMGPAAKTNY